MRKTKIDHEQQALRKGQTAVYSIRRDWIKGQVTAIEAGMLSLEGAFLGQIMLPTGETVLDRIERDNVLSLRLRQRHTDLQFRSTKIWGDHFAGFAAAIAAKEGIQQGTDG